MDVTEILEEYGFEDTPIIKGSALKALEILAKSTASLPATLSDNTLVIAAVKVVLLMAEVLRYFRTIDKNKA